MRFISSPPGQNGHPFTDDIFKCIFMNEKFCISIWFPRKILLKSPTGNKLILIKAMARRRTGDKPLPETMLTQFTDAYAGLGGNALTGTRPQQNTGTAINKCSWFVRGYHVVYQIMGMEIVGVEINDLVLCYMWKSKALVIHATTLLIMLFQLLHGSVITPYWQRRVEITWNILLLRKKYISKAG